MIKQPPIDWTGYEWVETGSESIDTMRHNFVTPEGKVVATVFAKPVCRKHQWLSRVSWAAGSQLTVEAAKREAKKAYALWKRGQAGPSETKGDSDE